MPKRPTISIIIPCYNSGSFLSNTIDSLLSQDIADCEIVLVDDGSEDDTLQIMKAYEAEYTNIVVISQENKGVSAARNKGILTARGDYLYFLDSDDYLTEGTLAWFKMSALNNPQCEMLGFGYKMLHLDGREKLFVNEKYDNRTVSGSNTAELFYLGKIFLNICSVLLKRSFVIDNQLRFKEGIKIGEDYDLLREVVLLIDGFYYSKRICFVYIRRKGSATDVHNGYGTDNFKSLLLSFDSANKASNALEPKTVNYFKAARYSAHLKAYLQSNFESRDVNDFFRENRKCLYRKIKIGRPKVMLAISFLRVFPVSLALRILKT